MIGLYSKKDAIAVMIAVPGDIWTVGDGARHYVFDNETGFASGINGARVWCSDNEMPEALDWRPLGEYLGEPKKNLTKASDYYTCRRCNRMLHKTMVDSCPYCGYPEGEPPILTDLTTPATGLIGKLQTTPRGGKRENSGRKAATPGSPRSELFSSRVTVSEWGKLTELLENLRKSNPGT